MPTYSDEDRSPSPRRRSRSPSLSPSRRRSRSRSPSPRSPPPTKEQYAGSLSDDEDDHDGLAFRDTRQKHLVNPLTIGSPKIDYGEVFGYDLDPENLQPGMKIWRMDHLNPVELDNPSLFGQFHSNDSYIILHITGSGDKLVISVHHWQGRGATQDKCGSVAIRSIEMNIYLGGACRLYREIEGQESEQFKSYFNEGLEYLFGGTEPAFKHVIPNHKVYEPRLYQIRKLPRTKYHQVKLVEPVNKSLNKHDVFVLDVGERIFQWNGSGATNKDRAKGLHVSTLIKNCERAGFAKRVVVEDGDNPDYMLYETNMFWDYLGGHIELPEIGGPLKIKTTFNYVDNVGAVAVLVKGSWDDYKDDVPLVEMGGKFSGCLALFPGVYQYHYRVVTEDGVSYEVDQERKEVADFFGAKKNSVEVLADETNIILYNTYVKDGKLDLKQSDAKFLTYDMLDTNHAYILDAETEVFVWFGKKSSKLERTVAKVLSQKFMQFDRPSFTPRILFYETAESVSFIQKFAKWRIRKLSEDFSKPIPSYVAGPGPKPKWDVRDLIEGYPEREPEPFDESKGQAEVWVLSGPGPAFEKIPQNEKGYFYSRHCYLVLYSYSDPSDHGKRKYVAYFWEGRDTNSSKWWPSFLYGFYPLLEKKVGGAGRLRPEYVLEHKEPEHFVNIFGGLIVVRKGSRSKLVRRMRRTDALFDVRESYKGRSYAIQVPTQASSLTSRSVFVLATQTKMFIWYGSMSIDAERDSGKRLSAMLKSQLDRPITEFEENEEPAEFWELLGGKGSYFDRELTRKYKGTPRLFHLSFGTGAFVAKEVENISQGYLTTNQDDCWLLDAYCEAYIWNGSGAGEEIRYFAGELAKEYTKEAEYVRKLTEVSLVHVEAEKEPQEFTRHFHAWSPMKRSEDWVDPFEKRYKRFLEYEQSERKEDQKRKKAARKERKRERKVHPERFILKKVDFRPELEKINIHVPSSAPTEQKQEENLELKKDDSRTLFSYQLAADSEEALAVMLEGSWNNWEGIPLIQGSSDKFATAVELAAGRYHYRFKIVTEEGVYYATDKVRPVTKNEEDKEVNILRVLKKKGEVQEEQKLELTEEEEERIATESFGKVNLNYVGSEALAVELYADWNDWEPTPMVQKEEGSFTKTVTLDPGKYRYRYRVASEDGLNWETDKERPVVTDETGTYNSLQVFAKLLRGKYVSKEHQEMENMTVEEKRRLEARSSLDEGEKRRLDKKRKQQEERAEQRRLEAEAKFKKEEDEKKKQREEKLKREQREMELQQQQWEREREDRAKQAERTKQLEEERRKAEEKAEEELRALDRDRRRRERGIASKTETTPTSERRSRASAPDDSTSSTSSASERRGRASAATDDSASSSSSSSASERRGRASAASEPIPSAEDLIAARRERRAAAASSSSAEETPTRRSRATATDDTSSDSTPTRRSRAAATDDTSSSDSASTRRSRATAADTTSSTSASTRSRATETAVEVASTGAASSEDERARLRAERRKRLGLDS